MKNRLNLNFQIESAQDRSTWLKNYLAQHPDWDLSPSELETCANYVLWGKNQDGLNVRQTHEIQLETKHGTWDTKTVESLEALQDSPTFNEASVSDLTDTHFKVPKTTFSRAEARRTAPPEVLETLETLWRTIDTLELELNYYEILHGKRTKPPRDALLNRFSETELTEIQQRIFDMAQSTYLKKRHLLVDLRRDQYGYKDLYVSPIYKSDFEFYQEKTSLNLVDALPCGLNHQTPFDELIFPQGRWPSPFEFDEPDLNLVYQLLWRQTDPLTFDFSNLEHVYNLLLGFDELSDEQTPLESELPEVLATLLYYVDRADLTPIQRDILTRKINHEKNIDIASVINRTYQKSYNSNYISTIFRQKIIPAINEAALHHREILENIFYPENFQKCRTCGQILLLSEKNFVHKQKSKTGFTTRCKSCDREERKRKKETPNDD